MNGEYIKNKIKLHCLKSNKKELHMFIKKRKEKKKVATMMPCKTKRVYITCM